MRVSPPGLSARLEHASTPYRRDGKTCALAQVASLHAGFEPLRGAGAGMPQDSGTSAWDIPLGGASEHAGITMPSAWFLWLVN